MLIPKFRISQTDIHLIIVIYAPYVKISSAEVHVEKNKFSFYLKPYLLNLNFKNDLKEDNIENPVYDHNTCNFNSPFDNLNNEKMR